MIGGTPLERAAHYRERAREIRSRGAKMRDAAVRLQMERVAALWDTLADREAGVAVPGRKRPEAV